MATRRINGRPSRVVPAFDARLAVAQAGQVTESAAAISRLTEDVSQVAETQVQTLERALGAVNQMAASLKETASQADSVSVSAEAGTG